MIYGIIYKVTFPNEKVYIGQTKKTLEQRKNQHFRYLNKKKPSNRNYVLYRAFEKYGFNNTKWEIIDNAEGIQEELKKKDIKKGRVKAFISSLQEALPKIGTLAELAVAITELITFAQSLSK